MFCRNRHPFRRDPGGLSVRHPVPVAAAIAEPAIMAADLSDRSGAWGPGPDLREGEGVLVPGRIYLARDRGGVRGVVPVGESEHPDRRLLHDAGAGLSRQTIAWALPLASRADQFLRILRSPVIRSGRLGGDRAFISSG